MTDSLFEKRSNVRRNIPGDGYVDAALKSADEFSMPFQELVTSF
jgi:4-carboxymuconolactone decarboxylase